MAEKYVPKVGEIVMVRPRPKRPGEARAPLVPWPPDARPVRYLAEAPTRLRFDKYLEHVFKAGDLLVEPAVKAKAEAPAAKESAAKPSPKKGGE